MQSLTDEVVHILPDLKRNFIVSFLQDKSQLTHYDPCNHVICDNETIMLITLYRCKPQEYV